jgi:coatomer protein complex subunit epsilon
MSSDLFELRNYFVLGNYQAAINAGNAVKPATLKNENDKAERDCYVYRSYIAQGNYALVLQEIKEKSSHPSLQAVRLLALYLSKEDSKDLVLSQLKTMLQDTTLAGNSIIQLVAGTVYFHEESYEEAMRCVYQSVALEGCASFF